MYSQSTPHEIFDLRCEYEVPRYVDLLNLEDEEDVLMSSTTQFLQYLPEQRKHSTTGGVKVPHHVTLEEEFFQWF
jgi:hypothetical protein